MKRISLFPCLLVSPSSSSSPSYSSSARRHLGTRRRESRRGAFMVVVMICLLVSSLIVGALLKLALMQSRQLVQEQRQMQAEWLADSGLERAASRLATDPNYGGETWNIEPDSIGGQDAGLVTIKVEKDRLQTQNRSVTIEAVYPADGPSQVRRRLAATVAISQES